MIELRTLGTTELRDAGGVEYRAILQQPKRLALLVYLVVAKPGRYHRRDSLLASFWPDLDQDHARAALRRALYFLRQALGNDVIQGRGDEEVAVDPSAVWCDVIAFDRAIAEQRLDEALTHYQGPFLDGLYIQGAAEAEEWLDRERQRLRLEATGAAWKAARATVGVDVEAVVRLARRAIDFGGEGEDAALDLAAQLEKRGERTAASTLLTHLTNRRRAELGQEPSEAMQRALRRLRPVSGSPAIRAIPERHEAVVVVCPFVVRGDGPVGYLGEGMVDLVSTKLDGAGAFRTVEPALALRASRNRTALGADVETGMGVAKEVGAGFFVTGAVLESGGHLSAALALYEADGRLRVRAEARASAESDLFELVDDLVRRVVVDFDQTAAGRLTRLAGLTTTSLAALKAYLQGEHEFRLGRHLQALDAYRRATAEDRSFALAYYRLASSLAATALIGPARGASAEAYRFRDRLSDHDRTLLEAQHAWLHGHTTDAEHRYASLTTAFPEQVEPWFLLGDLLFHSNPYRGRSVVEAKEPLERALELDPAHQGALTQLARIAALEQRSDELAGLVERALASSPAADQALGLRVLRAFALGRVDEQREMTAELARASGLAMARAFSDVALYARDLDGAERLAEALRPAARSAEFEALGEIIRAHLSAARGQRERALEQLRAASRHEPSWALEVRGLFAAVPFGVVSAEERRSVERDLREWDPATARSSVAIPLAFHDGLHPHLRHFLLGLLRARASDPSGVAIEAEQLGELSVPTGSEALVEQLTRTLDAERLRLSGKPADALAALERIKTDVWFQLAVGSPFYAGTYQRYLRAELLLDAGRVEEALGWWSTVAQRSPYELLFLAAAERRQAETLARRGRLDAARDHEARAKALWREDA